jgi:cytoskeleton protein RodZ
MIKMTENKKHKAAIADVVRPQNDSVGEMLRVARVSKNLTLEEVSAALRIRHVQLRALEENNIEALPGITYAVGFVRSYANFVGLNGVEIVHKFKAEQGHSAAQSKLDFPEPVNESRMPDTVMVGIGAALAVVVLVLWAFYSNINSGSSKEAQIQPPPAVTTTSETPETPPAAPAVAAAVPDATPAPATPPAAETAAVPAPVSTTADVPPAPVEAAVPAPVPAPAEPEAVAAAVPPVVAAVPVEASAKEAAAPAVKKTPEKTADSVIKIKRGRSHVLLQANQASWVQITDAKGDVIFKKVLRPGDQYYVPDQPGLSLVTANAGGLDVSVDGKLVQPIGKQGEIVRGVTLDPADLKKKRARISD